MNTSRLSPTRPIQIRLHTVVISAVALLILASAICARPALAGWQLFGVGDGLPGWPVYRIIEDGQENLWFETSQGFALYDGVNWTTFTPWPFDDEMNFVTSALVDRDGAMWFGTYCCGVGHYDGVTWTNITTNEGLASNDVWSICQDRTGNLWFGTHGGVSRYDGAGWQTFTTADGLASNEVWAVCEDGAGNLWCGTYGGVSRYDGVSWRTFTTADGLGTDFVRGVFADSRGSVWVRGVSGDGLSRYDGATWKVFKVADGLARDDVISITEDPSGSIWVTHEPDLFMYEWDAVSVYDGVTWRKSLTITGWTSVYTAFIDRAGNVWVATSQGAYCYDGAHWKAFTNQDGLSSSQVLTMAQDHSGNMWFGTNYGANRYDPSSWEALGPDDGLCGTEAEAIFEDSRGGIWVAASYGCLSRCDSSGCTTYPELREVRCVTEDHLGSIWVGTAYDGAYLWDNQSPYWRHFTTNNGLVANGVYSIIEDDSSRVWFATVYGVSRLDPATWSWRTFTTQDGLASNAIRCILEDRSGNIWFSTQSAGVTRYDGSVWRTFTSADGLASNRIQTDIEDHLGRLWFGTTDAGASCYDGTSWRTFTTADGLPSNRVDAIAEDSLGNLWFGTDNGLARFDGVNWGVYTVGDGLAGNEVCAIMVDHLGRLWFGHVEVTAQPLTMHVPDLVPPQTVVTPRPPRLSASNAQTAGFAAAHGETRKIEFSHSLDGAPWSLWSPAKLWQQTGLADGVHVLTVRARDGFFNVDSTPSACAFEIDTRPPTPVISSPAFGQAVRDSIAIRGAATDLRFSRYRLEFHAVDDPAWNQLAQSSLPVTDGALGGWNTVSVPDGDYEVRLAVTDTLSLTGSAVVRVSVDNHAPWASETVPAVVSAAQGGNVYTTDGSLHLYFPPHAFAGDTEVKAVPPASQVPDSLENGARLVFSGYEISWGSVPLAKPAIMDMSYAGAGTPSPTSAGSMAEAMVEGAPPVLYVLGADAEWRRLGGSVGAPAQRISAAVTQPGLYAVFAEEVAIQGTGVLSGLSVTPRVFSPNASFAASDVAIGFSLGQSSPVTVKVYNRAGRLVRVVLSDGTLGPGANIVRWDGRDADGVTAAEGLYVVTVEASGQKHEKTVGVVR